MRNISNCKSVTTRYVETFIYDALAVNCHRYEFAVLLIVADFI